MSPRRSSAADEYPIVTRESLERELSRGYSSTKKKTDYTLLLARARRHADLANYVSTAHVDTDDEELTPPARYSVGVVLSREAECNVARVKALLGADTTAKDETMEGRKTYPPMLPERLFRVQQLQKVIEAEEAVQHTQRLAQQAVDDGLLEEVSARHSVCHEETQKWKTLTGAFTEGLEALRRAQDREREIRVAAERAKEEALLREAEAAAAVAPLKASSRTPFDSLKECMLRWGRVKASEESEFIRAVGRACNQCNFTVEGVCESALALRTALVTMQGDPGCILRVVQRVLAASDAFNIWAARIALLIRLAHMTSPVVIDAAIATLCTKCPALAGVTPCETAIDASQNASRMLAALLVLECPWLEGQSSQEFLLEWLHTVIGAAGDPTRNATIAIAALEVSAAELYRTRSRTFSQEHPTLAVNMKERFSINLDESDPVLRRIEMQRDMAPKYSQGMAVDTPTVPPVYNLQTLSLAFRPHTTQQHF